MKKSKYIYAFVILLVTFLTYKQYLGLNAFLIPLLIAVVTYFTNRSILSKKWLLSVSLWILSGLGLFLWHLDVGLPLFLITGLHYFSVSFHTEISLPISLLQGIISFFTGIIRFFNIRVNATNIESLNESGQRIVKKTLLIIIPIVIFFIFLKLYQSANPEFERLTAFISFDFIELPFLLQFGLLSVLSYGLFFYKPSQKIMEADLSKPEYVKAIEDHHVNSSFLRLEWQLGLVIIATLSLLLIAFIAVDFSTIFGYVQTELNHSENVHQGINVLIGSIVLVIVIVLYFFKGQLNFEPSHTLKSLAYTWLFLNIVLIALIVVKNSHYIGDWGLTHKRIGVYIYLLLCIIGLVLTANKIRLKWSTSILVVKVSNTFLSILVLYGLFNWNGFIAQYNLNDDHIPAENIDFDYLVNLGPETYVPIINYFKDRPESASTLEYLLSYDIHLLNSAYDKDWTYFLSYTYSGYKAYQVTKNYDFFYSYPDSRF